MCQKQNVERAFCKKGQRCQTMTRIDCRVMQDYVVLGKSFLENRKNNPAKGETGCSQIAQIKRKNKL